jgi:hypothetical protein
MLPMRSHPLVDVLRDCAGGHPPCGSHVRGITGQDAYAREDRPTRQSGSQDSNEDEITLVHGVSQTRTVVVNKR